ncbi:MAG: OmpA family protein [Ferruginibacter sp.]
MFQKYCLSIILVFSFTSFAFCQKDIVGTIYFKNNSYSIDKKYKNKLDFIAKKITPETFRYLKIFGYASTTGSDSLNDELSLKRANAVYNYLATHARFDTTQVYVDGIGKSGKDVSYDLHFPQAHIRKRCVDVWVMFKRKKN